MEPAALYLTAVSAVFGVWILGDRLWAVALHLATRDYSFRYGSRAAVSLVSLVIALSLMKIGTASAAPVPEIHRVIVEAPTPDPASDGSAIPALTVGRWMYQVTDDRPVASSPTSSSDVYEVVPGDSLWRIAHEALSRNGHTPSGAETGEYWRSIFQLNRDVIGDNPNLIFPGQILELPGR